MTPASDVTPASDAAEGRPIGDGRPADPHFLRGELACPHCGSDVLEAVSDGSQTNLLCHNCWTCWLWDLGWMAPVPVDTCPGCYHRPECLRRQAGRSQE